MSAVTARDIAALLRDRPPIGTPPAVAAGWVARKESLLAVIEAERVAS